MKWAIAVMGGLFGAILGASLWRLFNLDPTFAWAGAATGLVALGLLSFILFRGCIMMYTSLQGSVMLIFGILGLVYNYKPVAEAITKIDGAELIPLQQINQFIPQLREHDDKKIIIHCKSGGRSLRFAEELKRQGFEDVKSMAGGIILWNKDINPGGPLY